MDEHEAKRKVAALKAIVQTLVLEHYWDEDETEAKRQFLALAEAHHPVAMAIVNELTDEEFDAAFRWPHATGAEAGNALPATPVMAFLTEEQYERARVAAVVEDVGDRARTLEAHESGVPGLDARSSSEQIQIVEERFVSAIVEDLVRHRGEEPCARAQGTVDERIAAMPEPWRSRSTRELERLGGNLQEMLG